MSRRAKILVVLFLSFIATGAQWDLLQTFAWSRMMAKYSRAMPLSEALAKTFEGEMCDICRIVANAQKQERSRPGILEARIEGKILLFFQAVPKVIVDAPRPAGWFPGDLPVMTSARPAPPVPPPRPALA